MSDRNLEQIKLVTEELVDLDQQVTDGDIDSKTAESLREKYREEIDRLMADRSDHQLSVESAPSTQPSSETHSRSSGRGRAIAGTAIVVVAVAVIGIFGLVTLGEAGISGAEGVVGDVVDGDGPIDLSTISKEEMETVVARNPEVVGMRLALARRYFDAGEFTPALEHYMIVLGQEPHPEALANVGWMTFMSGRPDVALGYIEAALQRQPDSLTAIWYLGNVHFALGNAREATAALTTILDAEGVPEDVKDAARLLLRDMETG